MDSLTHVCLGACVGELLIHKQLGKKVLLWGIVAQNLPDIDSMAALFLPADRAFLIHRGITHSLFFAIAAGLLLAWLARRVHYKTRLSFAALAFFFCFQLLLHDLLDVCNSYGTGLLEPFSNQRFSVNLLYVADPFFTVALLIAAILLIFKGAGNKQRSKWAWSGIVVSALYLCFSLVNKVIVDKKVEESFAANHLRPSKYFTTPAPFNNMLWYVVADGRDVYYTGYRSIWDDRTKPVDFEVHDKNRNLLQQIKNYPTVKNMVEFANEYYTLSLINNKPYLNVFRFEQVQGWQTKNAPFAFSYPLLSGDSDAGVLQKGRLAGWNKHTVKLYIERIAGEPVNSKSTTK
ncbi:metal-dependent hydrolase [Mucilaginibacter flavidus]|uniref:metal-dependent hydrolase n=1 Tax=Mucilaginibacter flavidus TaxID=2949309 RepID=UPI00209306FC|nr:metal-dependent hydrolase [Mucilaginibacter flavidus]MCO5949613.1 metal-dependent hydrolase [Mucilaginibacter flavidus]